MTFPVSDKLDLIVGARKYDLDVDYTGQSKFGYRGSNVSNGRDYDVSGDHSAEPLNMNDTLQNFQLNIQLTMTQCGISQDQRLQTWWI